MPQGKGTPCLAEKPFGKLHKCLCTCLGFSARVCVKLCWFLGPGLVKESSRVSQDDTVVISVGKQFPWKNKTVTVYGASLAFEKILMLGKTEGGRRRGDGDERG